LANQNEDFLDIDKENETLNNIRKRLSYDEVIHKNYKNRDGKNQKNSPRQN